MKAEIFTTITNLKGNTYYEAAKAGDFMAAFHLAKQLVSFSKAKNIINGLPDGTNITPVYATEKNGINEIPHALAWFLSDLAGIRSLYVDTEIEQTNKVFHTGTNAINRLIAKPIFAGTVVAGEYYYLVDDVVTTGSSLNELRLYIEKHGGLVAGCACLGASYSRIYGHSSQISMEEDTINEIIRKFDTEKLNEILKHYGYQDFKELTNGQGKFICSFKSLDTLRKRIDEAEKERIYRSIQKTFPEWEDKGEKKRNRGLKM